MSLLPPNPQTFFNHLWRAGRFSYFWTAPGKVSSWFKTTGGRPTVNGQNTYFGVNPTNAPKGKYQRAKVEDVAAINCLYAEFDVKDFGSKPSILRHLDSIAAPSVIVDSGGGYHAYWLLKEPFITANEQDRSRAKRIQAAWVEYTKGDKGAKDLARVLRVPGSKNYKGAYAPNYPTVEFIKADLGLLFDLDSLAKLCKPQRRPARKPKPITYTDDIQKVKEALDRLNPSRADNYHDWYQVGMVLSGLGAVGLNLWDNWSQQSDKYKPGFCEKKWRTFKPDHGLTIASLFHWANQDNPRPIAPPRPIKPTKASLTPEAIERKAKVLAEVIPTLKPLTFKVPLDEADNEKCPKAVERHIWTFEGGKGKTPWYCNDSKTCQFCRERQAAKLRYYLEEISRAAYVDKNGNAAYSKPIENEAGEFFSPTYGPGFWYAKILAWGEDRRNFTARYRRERPGGFIRPEVYPILDNENNKYIALSLAPFEDMQPVQLTDDMLQRIAMGAAGTKSSLLFGPPKKQLSLALPRYTFEMPSYLHERVGVATVKAAHTVLFTGPVGGDDIYSQFDTKAKTFDEIRLVLEEVALKTIDRERLRGKGDFAPDYAIQSIHIIPEAKTAYLAVYNAGREGDVDLIDKYKRKNLPKLKSLFKKRVDKAIVFKDYMALSTYAPPAPAPDGDYWAALSLQIGNLHQLKQHRATAL